jgi:hypothetical protein
MTLYPLLALVYNGINSSIDGFRGKHDIMGSMAAGGFTGLLYKSTGARHTSDRPLRHPQYFHYCQLAYGQL